MGLPPLCDTRKVVVIFIDSKEVLKKTTGFAFQTLHYLSGQLEL